MKDNLCERPGGLELTCHLLSRYPLAKGAQVLDIGCGEGATVHFLREAYGLDAVGIEYAPRQETAYIRKGDGMRLPFGDASMDALFFECSLSCMAQPRAALLEARRVLKHDGAVFLSDVYRKAGNAKSAPAERPPVLAAQLELFREMGFEAGHVHTHQDMLASYWANRVFAYGLKAALQIFGEQDDTEHGIASFGYYSVVLHPMQTGKECAGNDERGAILRTWAKSKLGLQEPLEQHALHRWQLGRVAQTIEQAKRKSAFFRRHLSGVESSAPIIGQTMEGIPFTDEAMLAANGEQMLCVGLGDVARVRTFPTSGSTGPAKRVWFSDEDLARTADFFAYSMRQIVPLGKRVVIMMSEDKSGSIADLLREGLGRMGMQSLIYGRPNDLEDAGAAMKNAFVVGMPADMIYLCRKLPGIAAAGVLLSGDYIPPPVVQAIAHTWQCPVFCHYGLTETCYGLAVQCGAREGQHIRCAEYLIEIIDPISQAVLPPGQEGEIVLTSLLPKALPLIRYRTGDVGSLCAEPCGCGCGLPRLGPVRGRLAQLQEKINIHMLDDILYGSSGVAGYQARYAGNRLHIQLEGSNVDAQALMNRLDCGIELEYGEAAPWDIAGKRRLGGVT